MNPTTPRKGDWFLTYTGKQFWPLDPAKQNALVTALDSGEGAEVECSESGTECEESGGGRYAKNMISSHVDVSLTITWRDIKISESTRVTSENAASEFEECC